MLQPQHTCEKLLDDGGICSCSAALIKAKDVILLLSKHSFNYQNKITQASIPRELCSAVVQIALHLQVGLHQIDKNQQLRSIPSKHLRNIQQ